MREQRITRALSVAIIGASVGAVIVMLGLTARDGGASSRGSADSGAETRAGVPALRGLAPMDALDMDGDRLAAVEGEADPSSRVPPSSGSSRLRVHVRDTDGTPQEGVIVELQSRRTREPDSEVEGVWIGGSVRGASNSKGLVELDYSEMADLIQSTHDGSEEFDFRIRADANHAKEPTLILEPQDGMDVDLEVPLSGALRLTVLDQSGAIPDFPVCVEVFYLLVTDVAFRFGELENKSRLVHAGPVTYRQVPLGCRLTITARAADDAVERQSVKIQGPTNADELVEATIELGPPRPRLKGRLLDAQGKPMVTADITLSVWLSDETKTLSSEYTGTPSRVEMFETDDDGRFDVPFDRSHYVAGKRIAILSAQDVFSHEVGIFKRMELPHRLSPDTWDLGDLPFQPLPVIASGVVEDDQGRSVVGASVTVLQGTRDEDGEKLQVLERTTTEENGRFEIRYLREIRPLQISARYPCYKASPQALECGAGNVVLRLEKTR